MAIEIIGLKKEVKRFFSNLKRINLLKGVKDPLKSALNIVLVFHIA